MNYKPLKKQTTKSPKQTVHISVQMNEWIAAAERVPADSRMLIAKWQMRTEHWTQKNQYFAISEE